VNQNDQVTAADALAIITYLNTFGPGTIPASPVFGPPYYDTVANEQITAADALAVITYLNNFGAGGTGPSGEGEAGGALSSDSFFQQLGAMTPPAAPASADLMALLLSSTGDSVPQSKRRT